MPLNNRLYTVRFQAESGRYYTVTATDMALQDLCMGPHVRQRQQREDNKERIAHGLKPEKIDEPRGNGEMKGCRLWFDRVKPPFSTAQQKKDVA